MDAPDSYRRDDSIVSEHSLLVETTNDKSEAESLVFRLPTELTRLIFHECGLDTRIRVTLTHICWRWRQIAVNDASLWTNIYIDTIDRKSNTCLSHFLSFLGMQLDRTANLLLDVKWFAEVDEEFFVATLQLLREKAPFSRWRSLEVLFKGGSEDDDPWSAAPWSTADAFTNLEFLKVWDRTENTIISAIDLTITSCLKELEVPWHCASAEEITTLFAKSLTHIKSLHLDSLFPNRYGPFLPANVVNLELAFARHHPFPHIQSYTLRHCILTGRNTVDLRSMTTLVVKSDLLIESGWHVCFPALRELKLGGLNLDFGAEIEAPVLDTLYFMTPFGFGVKDDAALLSETNWSLQQRGCLLSPKTSVIADSYLPSSIIIHLLAKSPKVTDATLRFDDWTDAQAVLGRLIGFKAKGPSRSAENVHLCPRLSELRLDFHWEFSEQSASKKWLINALRARRESDFLTSLSIYARWRGDGAYVLLASG